MNFITQPEIIQLTKLDLELFRGIRLLALRTYPESFGASYEEEQNFSNSDWDKRIGNPDSSDFLLGAFSDGKLSGITGFYRLSKEKFAHKGMIWGVFVIPEARGKGIGRKLMDEALNRASKLAGLSVIQLCVAEPNIEALSLYKKLGFLQFGIEPYARKVDGKYISEIHMWKAISPF